MEDGMHIFLLIEGIEDGAYNIAHSLGYNPDKSGSGDTVDKRLEGHQHTKPHANKTESFEVGVLFQSDEADNGACHGA